MLLQGDAGHVVKAFGEFVVGGNVVVADAVLRIAGQRDAPGGLYGGGDARPKHGHPKPCGQPGQRADDDGRRARLPVAFVHKAFEPIHSGGFLGIGRSTTQVKRVEHRVVFHEYLVRANEVLYHNTMTVTFNYTSDPGASGSAPNPTNKSGAGARASKLQDEHFRALLRRFPTWGFYAH